MAMDILPDRTLRTSNMQTQYILGLLSFVTYVHASALTLLEPIIENVVHLQTSLPPPGTPGVWRKKLIWKARWVKEWKIEKKYRPVWRKVWSPVEIREWIPIPRPPPETHKPDEEHISVHPPEDEYPPISPEYGAPEGPPTGLPDGPPPSSKPPPFRPLPDRPPGNYGPPSPKPSPSTQLHPVPNNPPPEWPAPATQDLLQSYHTIQEIDAESFNNQKPPTNYHVNPPVQKPSTNYQVSSQVQKPSTNYSPIQNPPTNYQVNSPDPERQVVDYMQPPRFQQQLFRPPTNSSGGLQDPRNSVSPYASKLAQAVVREKLNQSLNPTERPSGLTDVVFKTSSPAPEKVVSSTDSSTSNVFIVTPVNFV